MAVDLTVDADLAFSVDVPGQRTVTGELTGSGKALQLRVSDPFLFAGKSDSGAIRGLAQALAKQGLVLTVLTPTGPLVTLGTPRTSWLQRRLTGSRHIRIERGAGLWSLLRGRAQAPSAGALPAAALAPPGTLYPLAPTLVRRRRRPVTTTHDPQRGGNPRLIMAPRAHPWPGDRQQVFTLRDDVTRIGAGPDCHIRLPGLALLHAEIRHDDRDEFVLVRFGGAPRETRVNGAVVDSAVLRTGSGLELGEMALSFYREEYADHGRPYGGRIGGELGRQRPQPSRPSKPEIDKEQT